MVSHPQPSPPSYSQLLRTQALAWNLVSLKRKKKKTRRRKRKRKKGVEEKKKREEEEKKEEERRRRRILEEIMPPDSKDWSRGAQICAPTWISLATGPQEPDDAAGQEAESKTD